MEAIILIVGAWLVMGFISLTIVQAARLLFVPAGGYLPWRRAWMGLMIASAALWLTFLRNALLVSGFNDSILHVLNSFHARVVLNGLEAIALLICATDCYRIFRHRVSAPPTPAAQVLMDWRGIIRGWSPEAEALLGWTAEETVNQELAAILIPEALLIRGTPARELHRQGLQHFRDTGESRILNTKFPTQVLRKDLTIRDVEVYVTAHITSRGTTFLGSIFPRTDLANGVGPRPT